MMIRIAHFFILFFSCTLLYGNDYQPYKQQIYDKKNPQEPWYNCIGTDEYQVLYS